MENMILELPKASGKKFADNMTKFWREANDQ